MFPLANVVSERDALVRIGVSRPTLHRWRRAGLVPYWRVGRNIFYSEGVVQKLQTASRVHATAGPLSRAE